MGWTYGVMGETQITASRANYYRGRNISYKHVYILHKTYCTMAKFTHVPNHPPPLHSLTVPGLHYHNVNNIYLHNDIYLHFYVL